MSMEILLIVMCAEGKIKGSRNDKEITQRIFKLGLFCNFYIFTKTMCENLLTTTHLTNNRP